MPLQFNLPAEQNEVGVVFDAAYARVTNANFDVKIPAQPPVGKLPVQPEQIVHQLFVTIWANAAAYAAGRNPVAKRLYNVPVTALTNIEQAYVYLKTQPLFAGATIVA